MERHNQNNDECLHETDGCSCLQNGNTCSVLYVDYNYFQNGNSCYKQTATPIGMTALALKRGLTDGDPDSFAFVLGFDDFLLEAVNPDAAVEHFADLAVLTYEDAAFGIF